MLLGRRVRFLDQLPTFSGLAALEHRQASQQRCVRAEHVIEGKDVRVAHVFDGLAVRRNLKGRTRAEAALSQATRGLFALVESYPQLKANDNVKQLQEELTGTENKIAFSRQFYNDSVNAYNNRRQSFPAVLAAASLGFGPIELFNMPDSEREVPKVALR